MALETRLVRRSNGGYAFRGWVPRELRELVPGGRSGQKWIALGTTNHAEARRRARQRSVDFDRELDMARARLRGDEPVVSQVDAEKMAKVWLHRLLSDDEQMRCDGPTEGGEETFRGQLAEADTLLDEVEAYVRSALASGSLENETFKAPRLRSSDGVALDPRSAAYKRLAREYMKATKSAVEALRERNRGEVVETPPLPASVPTKASCTVEQLIDAYVADPKRKRTPGTLKTYQTVFRVMREALGPDTPVDSIHRSDCERIRDIIMRLPKNAKQRFPDLSLEEAARAADVQGLERLGVAAINNYLNNLSSLFRWGVRTWRVARNPAEGLALRDDRDASMLRQAFAIEHLRTIFDAPLYRGCQNDEGGYATPGPNVVRRGRFWVPLLSLWTGMRLGECCQLHTDDVTSYGGVPVILINDLEAEGGDEADRKRVKTSAGRRFVPVHPELQRIGFLEFVEAQKQRGTRRLFPELRADKLGYLSGPFSKWFNDERRFLGKLNLGQRGTSFHSFRHNYRDALREGRVPLDCVRALGGWQRDSDGEEAIYGNGHVARILYKQIRKVQYPGLDLSHLWHAGR